MSYHQHAIGPQSWSQKMAKGKGGIHELIEVQEYERQLELERIVGGPLEKPFSRLRHTREGERLVRGFNHTTGQTGLFTTEFLNRFKLRERCRFEKRKEDLAREHNNRFVPRYYPDTDAGRLHKILEAGLADAPGYYTWGSFLTDLELFASNHGGTTWVLDAYGCGTPKSLRINFRDGSVLHIDEERIA